MAEQEKIRLFRCCHIQNDYDGFDKFAYCTNPQCPTKECWCDTVYQMQVCPCFLGDSKHFIDESDEKFIKETQKEFLDELSKRLNKEYTALTTDIMNSISKQSCLLSCLQNITKLQIPQGK